VNREVIEGKPCTAKSDLWALGCIIYQLLTNTHAFDAPSEYLIMKKILAGHVAYPDWFPPVAKNLIESLLQQKPEDRPSHKVIREHPLFCGTDFDRLYDLVPPPLCPTDVEKALIEVSPEEILELDEKCLYVTWVSKKKSLMIKSRQFMITDHRILLVNPFKKEIKNSMDWNREINVVKRNEYEIVLSNGKDHWLIEDFKDCDKLYKKILEMKKIYSHQ
jgi:serine/threonine protein kinase